MMCKTASGSRLLFCSVPHLVLGVQPDTRLLGNGPSLVLAGWLACTERAGKSIISFFIGHYFLERPGCPRTALFLEFNPV